MQLSLTFQNAIFNPKIKITDNANKTCRSHIEAEEIILVKKKYAKKSTKTRFIDTRPIPYIIFRTRGKRRVNKRLHPK